MDCNNYEAMGLMNIFPFFSSLAYASSYQNHNEWEIHLKHRVHREEMIVLRVDTRSYMLSPFHGSLNVNSTFIPHWEANFVPCSQTPVWEHISAKLRFARSYDVEFLPTWEREPHHFRRSEAGASGIGVPKQDLGHQECSLCPAG